MKRKILALFLAIAMLLTMVTACGGANTNDKDESTDSKAPVKDSVIIAVPADMATMDPLHSASGTDANMYMNLYDGLVDMDASGKFLPALAESWTISDDGLSYTFKLRKDVKFHNGEEFKASDVLFTTNAAKKSPYMANIVEPIKDAVVIDDYTVKINLKYHYAPFLLSMYGFYMLNEKAVTEEGDNYGQRPIGTGPYKFVNHDVGQRVEMERFDDYFKGPAPIKNLEFKVITDPNTTLIALQSEEIDFALSIPMIGVQNIKNNPVLTVHEFDVTDLAYVVMNNAVKPFDNVLVRQAINYTIDKDAVIQVAEEGMGRKAQSIFGKITFGYSENVKGYEYNFEKAKELLTRAGYPNGFKVSFKTMDGALSKGAEVIQENLGKIGITVNIETCEKNAYLKDVMSGNYEMGNLKLSLLNDADCWGEAFISRGGLNVSKYINPKVDELFSQGKKLTGKNERLAVYEEVAQIINDDAAVVPLYHCVYAYAGSKDLKVGYIDPVGIFKVADMHWEK